MTDELPELPELETLTLLSSGGTTIRDTLRELRAQLDDVLALLDGYVIRDRKLYDPTDKRLMSPTSDLREIVEVALLDAIAVEMAVPSE